MHQLSVGFTNRIFRIGIGNKFAWLDLMVLFSQKKDQK